MLMCLQWVSNLPFQAGFNFYFQVANLANKWVGIRKVKAAILKTVVFF